MGASIRAYDSEANPSYMVKLFHHAAQETLRLNPAAEYDKLQKIGVMIKKGAEP